MSKDQVPQRFQNFMREFPEVGAAYDALGVASAAAGPLDAKTIALIKVGISIAAQLEGAVKSHTRKALSAGATPEEIRHAALQAITTVGFPTMMTGLSAIDDVLAS